MATNAPAWNRNRVLLVGLALMLMFGGVAWSTRGDGDRLPVKARAAGARSELAPLDAPAFGRTDAKVTVVEFSDFACEFCARHATQVLPELRERYGDRIRYVFRAYPLSQVHPEAMSLAVGAACAHRQDGFWQFHDVVYSHYGQMGATDLEWLSDRAELDTATFEACLADNDAAADVARDLATTRELKLDQAPVFYVNGAQIVGAKPLDVFTAAIDAALAA